MLALAFVICNSGKASAVPANSHVCTDAMAQSAESNVDRITDWPALYDAFQKYSACDQASIAEGYDDIVVRLLTRAWDGGSAASALVKKNRSFSRFILRHITELASKAELELVKTNATSKCAPDSTELCASIAKTSTTIISAP
jgi:hypothetical protein